MSSSSTVLITGGTGLLAINWACVLRGDRDVILGTHRHSVRLENVQSQRLDLETEDSFGQQLDSLLPDLVVHTAGLTNVEQCEVYPDLAHQANVVIAQNVARATALRNIPLVHISTDHFFEGSCSFYKEDDLPHPLNNYAKTKLLAEELVRTAHAQALLIRTNFFCWGHLQRQSLTDWLIYNLREKKQLTVFDDVFFTPILADSLVLATHKLLEQGVSGIFNLVGDQRLSKYQFAMEVCEAFDLPVALVQRGQIVQSSLATARPRDMSLNNNKVRQTLGYGLGNIKDFLVALRVQEVVGRRRELLEVIY